MAVSNRHHSPAKKRVIGRSRSRSPKDGPGNGRMRIVGLIGSTIGLFVFLWAIYTHHVSREAHILFHEGSESSDHQKLIAANELFADLLRLQPRVVLPLDWAATQSSRAAILRMLGQMDHATPRLEEAVATYREALQEYPRQRAPARWAAIQNDLGLTLWRLGEAEDGTARLKEAVLAFQAALQERTRDRAPIQWAITKCALAFPLARIAEREGDIGLLRATAIAYDAALSILISAGENGRAAICRTGRDQVIVLLNKNSSSQE
jgi:tetratricopeptide (TPR) repeat protein